MNFIIFSFNGVLSKFYKVKNLMVCIKAQINVQNRFQKTFSKTTSRNVGSDKIQKRVIMISDKIHLNIDTHTGDKNESRSNFALDMSRIHRTVCNKT